MSHSRRQFLKSPLISGISLSLVASFRRTVAEDSLSGDAFRLSRDVPTKYFDGEHCWCHARAGIVPGGGQGNMPRVVMTMNTMDLDGSDVFKGIYDLHTDDLSKSWTEPRELTSMAPRHETIDGVERPVAASDFWPKWHKASKTLLGTGHSVVYTPEWKIVAKRPRHTIYAEYDPKAGQWNGWKKLAMPAEPKFNNAGAGCTQRLDEPDGTILLPIYFKPPDSNTRVAVMRCEFDGNRLEYVNHGSELGIDDTTRGVGEPSIATFGGKYFLTVRHDKRAYITSGDDGIHFAQLQPWTFDDGSELGSYNTQAHWVTHSDALYLVYTRRGLNNDHVFRHRAPLVMAQVDPERLCVLRDTEVHLVPERGARLGNFGVTDVSPEETWVTVTEWMQPKGCEKYGSDGSVHVARIHWNRPNGLF